MFLQLFALRAAAELCEHGHLPLFPSPGRKFLAVCCHVKFLSMDYMCLL